MAAPVNIAENLARVREQDEEAARALVEHFYPLVMKIVRAHLPRRMEAEVGLAEPAKSTTQERTM